MNGTTQSGRRAADKKPPYHYTECGLDDVYLESGFQVSRDAEYGDLVSVQDALGLHRVIGMHIIQTKKVLNGKEVRFLRKEMDLTQAELASLLGVTDQSVARWEKDQAPLRPPAASLLRVLFAEHARGKNGFEARKLLAQLEQTDAPRGEPRQRFVEAGHGWRAAACTA